MKKAFLLSAMAVLALSSCVKDTVVDMQKDEIKFSVTTDVATKAGAVATTTSTIEDFKVWGYWGTSLYFNEVVNTKDGTTWSFDNTYFWPNTTTNKLNCIAFSPADYLYTPTMSATEQTLTCTTDGSTDLLYAVNRLASYTGIESSSKVYLNFRHAFSQLVFYAYNENTNIKVKIGGIAVAKVLNSGTLNLSSIVSDTNQPSQYGSWTPDNNSLGSLSADIFCEPGSDGRTVSNVKYIGNNKSKNLISFHNESPETVKGLYVIPQELNYWDPTTDTNTTSITTNKAYFIISCKVWSINGSDITYLWGTESSYADIAVPVVVPTVDGEGNIDKSSKFEWKQGTKYAYTFNFSNGAGYVPPTEGGSGNGGDPVLVPITISLTVDEFVEGDAFNIDTNLETE